MPNLEEVIVMINNHLAENEELKRRLSQYE